MSSEQGETRHGFPEPDPKLGLCLAGGGGLSLLHIGLLEALEELGLRPGVVAGTSSGAVIGAFYASGKTAKETRRALEGFRWTQIIAPTVLRPKGLNTTKRLQAFFRKHLGDVDLADLPIRLKVTATNILDGTVVGFTGGPLDKCLAAAGAIAGMFDPVRIRDGLYYDAGGLYNLPLELFAGEGVERIIAANTIGRHSLLKTVKTVRDVLYQAYMIRCMHLSMMRLGPLGWQGKGNEEVILIEYRTHGASPGHINECREMIDETRELSLGILREAFGKGKR